MLEPVRQWARKRVFPLNLNLMLLLNHTTLFYFNLSNDQLAKDKYSGVVANWAKNVSHSQAKGGSTKSTTSKTLTSTSTSRSAPTSAPTSVSSGKIKGRDSTSSNPQGNANDVAITFGGLDEEDETTEREAALSSPAKEGKRLTSAVIYFIPHFSATLTLPTIGHCEDRRNPHSCEAGKASTYVSEGDKQGPAFVLSDWESLASRHGPDILETPWGLFQYLDSS